MVLRDTQVGLLPSLVPSFEPIRYSYSLVVIVTSFCLISFVSGPALAAAFNGPKQTTWTTARSNDTMNWKSFAETTTFSVGVCGSNEAVK